MAKSKSPSKNDLIPIADWEAADKQLEEIGKAANLITAMEAECQSQIDQAKSNLARGVAAFQKAIDRRIRSLEAFASEHKSEFGEARSRKLNFGSLGWRRSAKISISKDKTLPLIHEVFGKRAADYLHIKESIDKDALSKLTDEELKSVSARRKVTDGFFAEADLVKAAEH